MIFILSEIFLSKRIAGFHEGMGLLEYQTMPSLRDVAHDDGYVHLLYNSIWKFHQLGARQPLIGLPVRSEKVDCSSHPSQTISHLPGHSPPASPVGTDKCSVANLSPTPSPPAVHRNDCGP
jgi:hypothetical protein